MYATKALYDLAWEKAAAAEGTLRATFSRFGPPADHDGDITLPSAFTDGQHVAMLFAHNWTDKPIGRGQIKVLPDRAVFDGRFFLNTAAGREAYETVKEMAELQEYSYGYTPLDAEPGTFEGQPVRFLKRLEVHEVSAVLKGAGRQTGTDRIKAAEPGEPYELEEKPFSGEHSCRLADPSRFDRFRRSNNDRSHDGKRIDVIYGHPKSGGGWEQQSLRLPTADWDAGAARSYCASHSGSFEAAAKEDPAERFVAHGERVLAEATAYLERVQALGRLRAKGDPGIVLSPTLRTRASTLLEALGAVRGEWNELLTTSPAPPGGVDLEALFEQFRRVQARHGGA